MKRLVVGLVLALVLGAVGCSGGTDPATNVTNVSAQLNAHGHTTGEPATWWWEYSTVQANLGTANDTEVCGVGTGPKEADNRCGPGTYGPSDIALNVVITGLTPNTTYYFRACAKDQSWVTGACSTIHSFKTLAGTAYAFDRKWGGIGTANGQFQSPRGIAVDSLANVYVIDSGNDRIQKFTSTGGFVSKWGTGGSGNGQFGDLRAIATDSANNVYVVDGQTAIPSRIQKFNSSGGYITQWGPASGNGMLDSPTGIATDASANVYVSEGEVVGGTNRVQKYTSTGTFVTKWGSMGSGDGQFFIADDVATDPTGNVYVTDSFFNRRVQKFSSTGAFLTKWGTSGTGDGQFNVGPTGIATDSAGTVYVVDTPRVQKFSSTGTFITKFGSLGVGDGQFTHAEPIAVDRFGYVYVLDFDLNQITKFKPVQ